MTPQPPSPQESYKFEECGNCKNWMKYHDCPLEEVRKPSCGHPACSKFIPNDSHPPSPETNVKPDEVVYSGHTYCRKCKQVHWMHGQCPTTSMQSESVKVQGSGIPCGEKPANPPAPNLPEGCGFCGWIGSHSPQCRYFNPNACPQCQEKDKEIEAYRNGGLTEEILRRNDGYIKVGKGCAIVEERYIDELKNFSRKPSCPKCGGVNCHATSCEIADKNRLLAEKDKEIAELKKCVDAINKDAKWFESARDTLARTVLVQEKLIADKNRLLASERHRFKIQNRRIMNQEQKIEELEKYQRGDADLWLSSENARLRERVKELETSITKWQNYRFGESSTIPRE